MTGVAGGIPPPGDLGPRVLRNTAVQAIGRNLIALARMVTIAVIVRQYGADTFGEYAIMIALLQVAEGVADFGTTEVFVRDVARRPEQAHRYMRVLTAAKLLQVPAAFSVLAAAVYLIGYPTHLAEAVLLAGIGLVFFAGVTVYRVIFKATLSMERELLPELASVLFMIALVAAVADGSLLTIALCHLASRAVFFAGCYALGRNRFRPSIAGVTRADVFSGLAGSAAIGAAGFLVMVYEALDVLFLSRLATAGDVALYSGAQRLAWPLLMALAAVGGSMYPLLASLWPNSPAEFARTCQRGLTGMLTVGGLALGTGLAGAEFFLGLLGPGMSDGAGAFRILLLLCVSKAVSMTIGPALLVVKAQRSILLLVAMALVAKAAAIAPVASGFGYVGVAWAALAVDVLFVELPALYLVHRHTGFHPDWRVASKIAGAVAAAALLPGMVLPQGSLAAACAAACIYTAVVFLTRAVTTAEIGRLVKRGSR